MSYPFQVHCVCGGFGFPVGTASTKRVMLMGRALHSAGVPFHVWHLGSSSYPENTHKQGMQNGITWEYLSPSVKRPKNLLFRAFYFLWGCLQLHFRLTRQRDEICVYLYYQGNMINLWVLLVCRLLRIPVAQECCEWWPGTPDETRFSRWMYHHVMFCLSSGALPISTLIEKRIREVASKDYPVLRVPVLVDADEVQRECGQAPLSPGTNQPYLFWCGMVDGYNRDPLFLIRTLGVAGQTYAVRTRLVLAGPCSDASRTELMSEVSDAGLAADQVIITGFIPEAELFRLATHATMSLLPLWDDDRSKSRFPTKLGLYAATGRPVVTCAIGEIPHFLQDEETALFAAPGDKAAWANSISRLMKDEILCGRLSERMRTEVLPKVDYRSNAARISAWFTQIYSRVSRD